MLYFCLVINCVIIFSNGQYSNTWLPFMNMEYYFGIEKGDFYDAQVNCSNLSSHLVVIPNQETQSFINKTIRKIAGEYFLLQFLYINLQDT